VSHFPHPQWDAWWGKKPGLLPPACLRRHCLHNEAQEKSSPHALQNSSWIRMFNHYNSGSKLPDWLHLETKHPIHEDLALKSWLIIFLLSHQHDKRWVSHMQSQSLYVFQDYAVCILLSFCLESPCSWLTPQLILLQTWGFAYKLANSIHGFSFNITSSSLHVTRCSWLWELQVLIQSLEEIRVSNWLPTPARGHLLVGFHAVKGP
jgi:hypothetical protein